MVQIGEKDQGCKMINGVEKQYPKANQSVIQKAKYESQKFECNNKIPKILKDKLKNKKIKKFIKNLKNLLILNEDFIVAVSGGPDSLALAFLAKFIQLKKN